MTSVLIVTPIVPGGLPTQGTVIADRLRRQGIKVEVVPRARTAAGRLLRVLLRAPFLMRTRDCVLVDVFGGRAFVYESFAILCASVLKRRLVVMLHNGTLPDFVSGWPRWTKWVLSKPTLVLTPHGFLLDRLSRAGIRVDAAIPNFINLERYHHRTRGRLFPRFLYLRGMSAWYNPQMALRAFGLVQAQYPEASLTMAGPEGTESRRCRRLVEEIGLRNVTFAGLVPKEEIPRLADLHDIHLHTNRLDNMPVSIIEMWACGLVVVATRVGGVPELVEDGSDAWLVPSEDFEAMANACCSLLSTPEVAERLSKNGRRRAEHLSWQQVRPLWEQALFGVDIPRGHALAASPSSNGRRADSRSQ